MSSPDLSILLVTYRVRNIVRDCLNSLYSGGMDGLTTEVILVDNTSNDGTVEMVRAEFPQVRVIASDENLGFARANNRAISEATSKYILLLNPDTLVPPGTLTRCVAFLATQPEEVAAMSCRIESLDGTLQKDCSRRFVTPWSECCRALLLDRLFSRVDFFNREPIVGWDRRDTRPVEAILGAFMLIRRSALERIGNLDERFFLMYEDMDWCKRTHAAGYRILFWPDAHITHLGGSSWRQEKVATYTNTQISALQYIEKHHPQALGTVRFVSRLGMVLKIGLLRLNLLRKPGDAYTQEHLEMARQGMKVLGNPLPPDPPPPARSSQREGGEDAGGEAEVLGGEGTPPPPGFASLLASSPPSLCEERAGGGGSGGRGFPTLLYVSTLDRIIAVMFPHLEAARAAGWRVEVACQPTVYRKDLEQYADAIHELPMRRFPLHPANLNALRKLVRLIREGGYTIVHCHNPSGGIIGRLAATLARGKNGLPLRVYTAHGFHFHRHGGRVSNAVYRTAETVAGQYWSDAVLTITREDYDAALKGRVVPKDCLFLTGGVGVSAQDDFNPANITAEERRAARCEIGAENDSVPVVTMVGEFIPRKRHADAIAAFALVRQQFPNALLLLPGDGVLLESLHAQAAILGITDAVRFLGYRRDIARLLAASDVFLFPSQQEGLPCSVQEALSMEVPVVGTDVRGNADLIDNACGRLAELGDVHGLAEVVSQLLTLTPQERKAMGRAGREKMLRLYDRAACVARWQEIYSELLKRRGVTG